MTRWVTTMQHFCVLFWLWFCIYMYGISIQGCAMLVCSLTQRLIIDRVFVSPGLTCCLYFWDNRFAKRYKSFVKNVRQLQQHVGDELRAIMVRSKPSNEVANNQSALWMNFTMVEWEIIREPQDQMCRSLTKCYEPRKYGRLMTLDILGILLYVDVVRKHVLGIHISSLAIPMRYVPYSISQEICTRFCCALLCCGYAIVYNEFTWSIYAYSSGLLCWHWGNR